jgi:hypothetical protein
VPIYPVLNGEIQESVFSANHFAFKLIVPRLQINPGPDRSPILYTKKAGFRIMHGPSTYMTNRTRAGFSSL